MNTVMSCRLQTYSHVGAFAEEARPLLLGDEARNNLQLGLIQYALEDDSFTFDFAATVKSRAGQVIGVLTRTPGRSLVTSILPPDVHEAVVHAVSAALPELIGVLGPSNTVDALAPELAKRFGTSVVPHVHHGILTLSTVTCPTPAPGRFKVAQTEHLPVVLEWMSLFHKELPEMGTPPPASLTERRVRAAQVFLWFDQHAQPASMAILVRASPHGGIIGYVYTPQNRRGRGFASNCVAHASQAILEDGKSFCGLYVDLTNPVSTRMYANLGYQLIGESNELRFASSG